MDQPPRQPENDEYQDERSKGDVKCHGGTGFHAAMNVGHQPADQILHEQKRYDEPVEHLRGGPVLQTVGHDFSYARVRTLSGTMQTALPLETF
jgi:hypothetical protein